MSSRPRRPPASSRAGSDLDSTAELPVLFVPEPAATTTTTTEKVPAAGTQDHLATTGTWAHPLAEQGAPSAAATSAEEQRQQQLELESRTTALREAEERLASHAKRLLQLEQARDEALASQAAAAQRAASAEQRAASAEQRADSAEQRASGAEQRSASAEQRLAKLEQRAATLSAELSQRQAAAAQNAARVEESARALAVAEQRASAASEELAQARAVVGASGARAQELQQRLEQQESAVHAQRTRELEQQQTLATAGRAHAAGLMVDLHDERARAMSYLESLQTLERRREIAQHLVTELNHEAEDRAAELVQLTRELASRDELAHRQEEALTQRAGRIAQLEQQVSTLTTMVSQRDAQLQDRERQQRDELARLRSEIVGADAALEAAQRSAAAAAAQASSQQSALAQKGERAAQLEAWLTAERQRAAQLEGELATVRGEMEDWGSVLRSAQQERGGHLASIAAAESRVRELEQAAAAREERVRALEKELHGAAHHAVTDIHPALRDPARHAEEEAPGDEPMPDGATRLLIHSADGREVVHVLGRKTSIGRTPDNDLQLDAKFISRHHAVILVGPASAVIEDLNSTNGVHVNGRRVIRQTLRDGDQIAIGRMHYRFVVRKAADKR
jgi:chromosome segregation ATPase